MLSNNDRKAILELMHRQVVPAIGCTEPIAVALCAAKAKELLGQKPERIDVRLSANVLKNAMGVPWAYLSATAKNSWKCSKVARPRVCSKVKK